MNDLEADDVNMVQELGNLTPAQLLDKIRKLQNLAYQLGLEEGKWSNYVLIIWIASYVSDLMEVTNTKYQLCGNVMRGQLLN